MWACSNYPGIESPLSDGAGLNVLQLGADKGLAGLDMLKVYNGVNAPRIRLSALCEVTGEIIYPPSILFQWFFGEDVRLRRKRFFDNQHILNAHSTPIGNVYSDFDA